MYYLLFFLYFALGCLLVTKIPFVTRTSLPKKWILSLFAWKIFCGVALGWITKEYFPSNDYWALHSLGIQEWELLINKPKEFFTNITYSPYQNEYGGFFNSVHSFWNDLRNNIIIKLLAITNNCSQGNYYINSLFFNFWGFLGHMAIYRIFINQFPDKKKWIIVGCFLLPSAMLYASGIHKDLLVFVSLAFFCYGLYFSIQYRFSFSRIAILFLSALTLLFVRNYVLMAVLPASIFYLLASKKIMQPLYAFGCIYGFIVIGIFIAEVFFPSITPLQIIAQKQFDFSQLPCANSELPMKMLHPDIRSFIYNLPQAIDHGFFRPLLWDKGNLFIHISSVEVLMYLIVILIGGIQIIRKRNRLNLWIVFLILLTSTLFLFIGYTIPNSGSIVRYRSIYLPFLITPFLCFLKLSKENHKH